MQRYTFGTSFAILFSSTKKPIFVIIGLFCAGGLIAAILLLKGSAEDAWMCSNGSWIRHGNPGYSKPIITCGKTPVLPHTEEECLAEGGVWKKMGIDPGPTCNRKAIDRGNLCRDSRECEGRCQVELTREEIGAGMRGAPLGRARFGRCSVWVVELGCQGVMENGITKVICFD